MSGTITDYTNDRVTKINQYAFRECSSLASVNFPAATSIEAYAFSYCAGLTSVNFPAATSIEFYAFYGCGALTSANFPAATSMKDSAFGNCVKLTSANFPTMTSIGPYAFKSCFALASLILRATTQVCTLSSNSAFDNTPIESGTGYIYVPAALIDSYKTATNWTTYANRFRALESYTVDGTTTGELDPTKVNA